MTTVAHDTNEVYKKMKVLDSLFFYECKQCGKVYDTEEDIPELCECGNRLDLQYENELKIYKSEQN